MHGFLSIKFQKTMAKRLALIPEELVSSYHLQKPEIRIEDEIESLLEKTNLPNDMKVKLLGGLITRYHKTVHTPPEPMRVSVVNEPEESREKSESVMRFEDERTMKDIMFTVPQRFSKYVPMIVEKLKSRQYAWNEWGELTHDEKPIEGSKIVDFFSYIMRNVKSLEEPKHFAFFLKAIKETNIPRTWIANKKVLDRLKNKTRISIFETSDSEYADTDTPFTTHLRKKKQSRSVQQLKTPSEVQGRKSRSLSPKQKWLEY